MCLRPISIPNPQYDRFAPLNSLEGSLAPYLTVPCGKCIECCKKKAADWRFRITQDISNLPEGHCKFITLTLSNDYWDPATEPSRYLRLFFDRVRKQIGHSIKHFFVHEYGSKVNSTHRLHFHGILFDCTLSDRVIHSLWHYGTVFIGNECSSRTASYITKYLVKGYTAHLSLPKYWLFPPRVYASAGIGISFIKNLTASAIFNGVRYLVGNTSHSIPAYYIGKVLSRLQRALLQFKRSLIDPAREFYWKGYHYASLYDLKKAQAHDLRQRLNLDPTILGPKPNFLKEEIALQRWRRCFDVFNKTNEFSLCPC